MSFLSLISCSRGLNHVFGYLQALQSLLSNPGVMSVESLERAHREESKTPPSNQRNVTGSNEMPPIPSKATSATELESDLKNKLNISKSEHVRQKNMDNHSYAGAAKSPNKRTQKVIVTIWQLNIRQKSFFPYVLLRFILTKKIRFCRENLHMSLRISLRKLRIRLLTRNKMQNMRHSNPKKCNCYHQWYLHSL